MRSLIFTLALTLPVLCHAKTLLCEDPLQLLAGKKSPSDKESLEVFTELFTPLHKREMEQIKVRLQKEGTLKEVLEGRMQATTVSQTVIKLQKGAGENWPNLRKQAIKALDNLIKSRTKSQSARKQVKRKRRVVSEPVRMLPNREANETVNERAIALSGDGRYLATANSYNSNVYIRDLSTGKIIRKIQTNRMPGHEHDLVLSNDGQYLAIVGNNVYVYKGPRFGKPRVIENEFDGIWFHSGEFSKDNKRLLIRAHPHSLEFNLKDKSETDFSSRLGGAAWYGPDGIPLYSESDSKTTNDATITVFRATKTKSLASYAKALNSNQRSHDLTKDGLWLATGGTRDGDFIVWRNGKKRPYFKKLFGDHVNVVKFSPDGKLIALGLDADKKGYIFDVASKKFIARIPSENISAITFSADGSTMFVVGTRDIIFDLKKWKADQ